MLQNSMKHFNIKQLKLQNGAAVREWFTDARSTLCFTISSGQLLPVDDSPCDVWHVEETMVGRPETRGAANAN